MKLFLKLIVLLILFSSCQDNQTKVKSEEELEESPQIAVTNSTNKDSVTNSEQEKEEPPEANFEKVYTLLIELQNTKNDEILNDINLELDKYLTLDRRKMDEFRFDKRFWDYAGYPFFYSLKRADPGKLNFNLFEFVLKIKPYYDATGEVEQGLSGLWAEIAYLKTDEFLEYIEPMDSTARMNVLFKPWWWEIPQDSLILKLKDEQLKKDLKKVFEQSG